MAAVKVMLWRAILTNAGAFQISLSDNPAEFGRMLRGLRPGRPREPTNPCGKGAPVSVKIVASETMSVEIEDLFRFLIDFESNLKNWAEGVSDVRRLSGDGLSVGSTYTIYGRRAPLQRRPQWTYEVTAWESPVQFGGSARGGSLPFREHFLLTPSSRGTHLLVTQHIESRGLLKLAEPLLATAANKVLQKNLKRLKQRAERHAATKVLAGSR